MRKYRLIHFEASKTGNNRRKLSNTLSKLIELKKCISVFEPKLYESVAIFMERMATTLLCLEKGTLRTFNVIYQSCVLNDCWSNQTSWIIYQRES